MNVRALALSMLSVLAHADTVTPQCPGGELLSNTILAHSGCVFENEVFSNFSATSVGPVAGINPLSVEFEFPSSGPRGIEVEFSGGITLKGGSSGATAYEIISYDVSALEGAPINDLTLGIGNVDEIRQSGASGSVFAVDIVSDGTGDRNATWAVPGHSAKISLGSPQSSVHVTDIVRLHAAPNGTVTIGGLSNRLLSNSEPGTVVLLGTTLIVLVKLARRALPN